MPYSNHIRDHENHIAARRGLKAYQLLNSIDDVLRQGDLGMINYPPCDRRQHLWMLFGDEHRRLQEIARDPHPSPPVLAELLQRTRCNARRSRLAVSRLPGSSQFNRVAHQHRRRLHALHRLAAEYVALF